MSWLSKWWSQQDKGDLLREALRKALDERARKQALAKLRMLLSMLDKMDVEGVRRELTGMIKYVEEL
jgi:hypothetical protein